MSNCDGFNNYFSALKDLYMADVLISTAIEESVDSKGIRYKPDIFNFVIEEVDIALEKVEYVLTNTRSHPFASKNIAKQIKKAASIIKGNIKPAIYEDASTRDYLIKIQDILDNEEKGILNYLGSEAKQCYCE